jgi:2,4-diketo-3-deoxy-L-fuconate hydrolase
MAANAAEGFGLGRFAAADQIPFTGIVVADRVFRLCDLWKVREEACSPARLFEDWDQSFERLTSSVAPRTTLSDSRSIDTLRILAPLPDTRQIFCTAANYQRHVIDMVVTLGAGAATTEMSANERRSWATKSVQNQLRTGRPFVFMKPITAMAGPCDDLRIPPSVTKLDWELELGVVMGRRAYGVNRRDAAAYVAGYLIVNDMSARDKLARPDAPGLGADWLGSKGAPGFLPTGPLFVPRQFIPDLGSLRMTLSVNGVLKQDDRPSDMIFDIGRQIEFITEHAAMLPGDILCTGSPTGNGVIHGQFLQIGDVIEAAIEGLGRQRICCI